MILNKKGILARLYKWAYHKQDWQMPNSLCPYFWKLVIAIILLPLIWVSYPFKGRSIWGHLGFSFLGWVALLVFGSLVSLALQGADKVLGVILFAIGAAAGCAVGVGIIAACIAGFFYCKDKIAESEVITETISIIREQRASFMENWCPKIDWED